MLFIILFLEQFLSSMEEIRRTFKKNTSVKQNKNDPLVLYSQCQQQLVKLNKQLKVYFDGQRHRKLDTTLPSLESLGKEINELKENISYEATPEETLCQRQSLFHDKERLLLRLKGHSNTIQKLKKRLRILNIDNDELIRQYQENKVLIENHANREDMEIMMRESAIQGTSRDSLHSEDGKQLVKNKSVPSLFSPSRKPTDLSFGRPSLHAEKESKWGKIDSLMAKLGSLSTDKLAQKLLKLAKKQKGGLKALMKNYQVSDKMKEFMKESEIREELSYLEGLLRRR